MMLATWKALPPLERGTPAPLPIWARALGSKYSWDDSGDARLDGLQRARIPVGQC